MPEAEGDAASVAQSGTVIDDGLFQDSSFPPTAVSNIVGDGVSIASNVHESTELVKQSMRTMLRDVPVKPWPTSSDAANGRARPPH